MTAPDLTKLTAKELHDTLSTGLTSWTPPLYAVMREFVRRAEGYALACADRDSARDELAEMKALRDAAKSDHKEACRILRNYQTLAEERGREIKALIRERDELHRRAQANALVQAERDEFDEELHTCRAIVGATSEHLHVDLEELVDKLRRTEADSRSWQELATARAQANDALLSTLSDWCFRRGADLCPTAGSADSFGEGMRAAKERVRRMLDAAAPAAPPTPAAPVTDADTLQAQLDFARTEIGGLMARVAKVEEERGELRAELAKLSAPVTDAEIEAAITALTVDARREADALRVNPEASGTATEKRANRQVQLRALIARRVASAGAAPVDSEREAAIEFNTNEHVWVRLTDLGRRALLEQHDQFWTSMGRPVPTYIPPKEVDGWSRWQLWHLMSELGHLHGLGKPVPVETVMRFSAPPAPAAGDQDAKLREAVEALETVATKQQKVEIRDAAHRILRGYSPCTNCGKWMHRSECHWPCNPIAPVATPAESAIAAAPEAPKREPWEERWNEAETGSREELLALRDGLSSHARRIEALERAAQEGSK